MERSRTKILAGVALLLIFGNAVSLFGKSLPAYDVNDEIALWFGSGREPMATYFDEDWPMLRRPMVIIEQVGASRDDVSVPMIGMIDNIGVDDYATYRRDCIDGCIGGPWFAFATAGRSSTIETVIAAFQSVRAQCNIEVVIFDSLDFELYGFPVFLAKSRDVPNQPLLTGYGGWELIDPTLDRRQVGETEQEFWDRTGCATVSPRRP